MAKFAIKSISDPVSRLRPVNIMFDEDVKPAHMLAVLEGLNRVLRIANVDRHVSVKDFGIWRNEGWLEDHTLTRYNSVDWYIKYAETESRPGQLHGGFLLKLLYNEPWQEAEPHYDILVTSSDLYDDDCRFCIGLAVTGLGTVISTHRFFGLSADDAYNCIVTETMHEVGHVFGLVPETRKTNVENSLGLHCTNRCIMRQGLTVPHDWLAITADRLKGHEFCGECESDLRRYFY